MLGFLEFISQTAYESQSMKLNWLPKNWQGELDSIEIIYTSEDELGKLSDSIRSLIYTQEKIIRDIEHIMHD